MNTIPLDMTPMGFDEHSVFRMPIRVYYEDTDAGGIVYHSIYLNYAERARTEYIRALGVHQQDLMETRGIAFAVASCAAKFRRPAKLDDLLVVETRLITLRGASLEFEQCIKRDAEPIFDYRVQIACISRQGRPLRLPPEMRQQLLDRVTDSTTSVAAPTA